MAHYSVHSKPFHLLINKKKGLHLSANRNMNQFKAAAIPVNFYTSLGLDFSATNNEAEYETLLVGMTMVQKMGGKSIKLFLDSSLSSVK